MFELFSQGCVFFGFYGSVSGSIIWKLVLTPTIFIPGIYVIINKHMYFQVTNLCILRIHTKPFRWFYGPSSAFRTFSMVSGLPFMERRVMVRGHEVRSDPKKPPVLQFREGFIWFGRCFWGGRCVFGVHVFEIFNKNLDVLMMVSWLISFFLLRTHSAQGKVNKNFKNCLVVSSMCLFQPCLGIIPILSNMFQLGWTNN